MAGVKSMKDASVLLEERGLEALAAALGGASVLVLRPPSEDDELISEHAAATVAIRLDQTASGEDQNPWAALTAPGSRVVPLIKSARNPFVGLITVGRAHNNDICLTSSKVSHIHAFLKEAPGRGWLLQDNGSRNGTFLNLVRLESKVDHTLNPMDEVRLANVSGMFLDQAGLASLCQILTQRSN